MPSSSSLPLPATHIDSDHHHQKPRTRRLKNIFRKIQYYADVAGLDFCALLITLGMIGVFTNRVPLFYARKRVFPMWQDSVTGVWRGELRHSYPKSSLIVDSGLCLAYLTAIPITIFLVMQIRTRSPRDFFGATLGLFQALILSAFTMSVIKLIIGELRPYFITYCKPNTERLNHMAQSLAITQGSPVSFPIFVNISVCDVPFHEQRTFAQYDDITNAMQSFPSGHTMNSFAAAGFLSLYLNAKLRSAENRRFHFWKTLLVFLPLLGAGIVACTVVVDRNHFAHDVVLSIPIGLFLAILAYLAEYPSLFDCRTNDIPRPYRSRSVINDDGEEQHGSDRSSMSESPDSRHERGSTF